MFFPSLIMTSPKSCHFLTSISQRLENVFELLSEESLALNIRKCYLFAEQITSLDHVISPEGCAPIESKLQMFSEWPIPRTCKQVKSIKGLCG
jgi:hypothetical protein